MLCAPNVPQRSVRLRSVAAKSLDSLRNHNQAVTRITDHQPEQDKNKNSARPVARRSSSRRTGEGGTDHVPCQPNTPRPGHRHLDQRHHFCSVSPCWTSHGPHQRRIATPTNGAALVSGPQRWPPASACPSRHRVGDSPQCGPCRHGVGQRPGGTAKSGPRSSPGIKELRAFQR